MQVMPKKRSRKTFLKIKEKLVFIAPKRFFGRKVLGIIFLILGTLVLAITFIYFFLFPKLFPPKLEVKQTPMVKIEFLPRRVLFPAANLNFMVYNGLVEGGKIDQNKMKIGEEILILGNNSYKIFRLTSINVKNGTAAAELILDEKTMKLILQTGGKPIKNVILEGVSPESNF